MCFVPEEAPNQGCSFAGFCQLVPINSTTHFASRTNQKSMGPTTLFQGKDTLANACSIWFCPPEERTARELRELTQSERERVWADLSGNSRISNFQVPADDPLLVEGSLWDLKQLLTGESVKTCLGIARDRSPDYVFDDRFLMKFLRRTELDAREAFAMLQRHFVMKRQLFGDEKLARDILFSDLSADDLRCLAAGSFQFLPEPDSAGRLVNFVRNGKDVFKDTRSLARAFWYHQMVATNSERAQKLGAVRVVYLLDEYPKGGPDNEGLRLKLKMHECIPLRYNAIYVVVNPGHWTKTVDLALMVASRYFRMRARLLPGTCTPRKPPALRSLVYLAPWFDHSLLIEHVLFAASQR